MDTTGPIPARAGEPYTVVSGDRLTRAYPRSRGGTNDNSANMTIFGGLSPLARGNLTVVNAPVLGVGPIPARAGEPSSSAIFCCWARAYPRSRGGTMRSLWMSSLSLGLSPLARGNLVPAQQLVAGRGPIPARAGEPSRSPDAPMPTRAYPRSRGGTAAAPVRSALA